MKTAENKTQFAILGMLSLGPSSGYEIKKGIESTLSNFWRENYGHIYPSLRRLEEAGLAQGEAVSNTGRPDSRRYTITPAGINSLREWLLQPTEPIAFRHELLLKFFFSGQISPDQQRTLLREYGDRMRRLQARFEAHLQERQRHDPPTPQHLRAQITNRFGILYCKACVEWTEESLLTLTAAPAAE